MTKCRLTGVLFVLGLVTFVFTAAAAPPAGASRHCVVKLQPVAGAAQLALSEPDCYPTFRDAIFFATGGIILLPGKEPLVSQLDLLEKEQKAREDQLVANSSYVLAVDYEHVSYGGSSLTWTAPGPCTPAGGYSAATMGSSFWNDRVSSTRGYSDCYKNVMWEHPNFAGTKRTCFPDCSSLGTFNDKASAREWHHQCEGVAGQWQGCRGTGCSVCSELVANYPCYFQNHPNCQPNDICGGLYFTCSDACPAPTQADTCSTSCQATASCANAGGGTAFCSGSNNSCFAVDDCYASCDGFQYYCPNPPGICPL